MAVCLGKRIAFCVSPQSDGALTAGSGDVSSVHSRLIHPDLGRCDSISPAPLHNCKNLSVFFEAFTTLLSGWDSKNQLILYFSGHGEPRNEEYCLKLGATNNDWLPFSTITSYFKLWNVSRAVIIIDACYSGHAIKGDPLVVDEDSLPKGVALLVSSGERQVSEEHSSGALSIFTKLFVEALDTGLGQRPTPDGMICVDDVSLFINQKLKEDDTYSGHFQRSHYTVRKADGRIWIASNNTGATEQRKIPTQTNTVHSDAELRFLYDALQNDRKPIIGATVQGFDLDLFEEFVHRNGQNFDASRLTELARENGLGSQIGSSLFLHRAAVISFCQRPEMFVPQATSIFVDDETAEAKQFREPITFRGPLSKQFRELFLTTMKHLSEVAQIGGDGLRNSVKEIDDELIRELISNAMIHRDFEIGGSVQVRLTRKFIEIKNPGTFRAEFNWECLLEQTTPLSVPADPALVLYAKDQRVCEQIGRGFEVIRKYISKRGADSISCTILPGPITSIRVFRSRAPAPASLPADASPTTSFPVDISRIIEYVPAQLIGREAETQRLNEAWAKAQNNEIKRPHILTFVALGGEGKTSLVAKWAAELTHQAWPGCDAVFAWSFYSQGVREQAAVSSDVFLKEALTFFGDPAMAGSAQGAFDKGRRLAQLVGEKRALLVLDGLEPLQYAPASPTPGELKDSGLAALLKGLAANNDGLCVVTTRYSIPDLRAYWQTTAPEVELRRLSTEAGVALLRSLGVNGTQQERETLVEEVKGRALTLNLLGTYLRDAHAGDIRKHDLVNLEEADEEQGGHAFRVMDAYVRWFQSEGKNGKRALAVLQLLGLFDRPADAGSLAALWKAPLISDLTEPLAGISEAHRNLAITRLKDAKLLTLNRDAGALLALDAHPLLREYFAKTLREKRPEAWRAAHRRLYEHLCATTKDKPQPTLEDLQPLYHAVAHGCQAGMQQEAYGKVYRDRIRRGQESYSTKQLGAFASDLGAVACFFEQPWSRVSPALTEAVQSWLLGNAAFRLRALGRLTEALQPLRAGLEMEINQEHWNNAAIAAGNLSELALSLGDLASAAADAEQAVTYAERSGDAFLRMVNRTTHAEALHQAGRRDEAAARFREAEEMQAGRQPEYPLLYSVQGFHYCDLFLAAAERVAWRHALNIPCIPQSSSLPESCRAVSERAARTHQWAELDNQSSLLEIALDHLTLGRAALYTAILEGLALDQLDPCRESVQHAVDGLRRSGAQHHLPRGLLTRAWLRCLTGARTGPESAQSDLDEAFEIAERGPMPLFLAEIHLYRARLFGLSKDRPATYPWTSPQDDLKKARDLIEKHGYWRRKEELEDAEVAARAVPDTP